MTEKDILPAIEKVAKLLIEQNLSIAFAESATAGRLSSAFSLACNAGQFLKGALVCYDAQLKTSLLGVSEGMIRQFSPESREVTEAITKGLSNLIQADLYVGITGLPCPGGSESPDKPVGSMFVCAYRGDQVLFAEQYVFQGSHSAVVLQSIRWTAELLSQHLS